MTTETHPLLIDRRVGRRKLSAISFLVLTADVLEQSMLELMGQLEDSNLPDDQRERIEAQVQEVEHAMQTLLDLEADLLCFALPARLAASEWPDDLNERPI